MNVIVVATEGVDVSLKRVDHCESRSVSDIDFAVKQIIGGLYAYESAASSYPEAEDLYLQEVWEIDSNGKFTKPIEEQWDY